MNKRYNKQAEAKLAKEKAEGTNYQTNRVSDFCSQIEKAEDMAAVYDHVAQRQTSWRTR